MKAILLPPDSRSSLSASVDLSLQPGWSRLCGVKRHELYGLALLMAVWLLCWWPGLLGDQTLPARDIGATQMPWRQQWRSMVMRGQLPLWDAASSGGRLMWANPNAMAAYPATLLFVVGSPEKVMVWHLAAHHLLFVSGCFWLVRRAGFQTGAALVGAAVAGFGGVAWSATTFPNFQASLAWLPWALGAVAKIPEASRRAALRSLAAGCFLGVAFLGGEPVSVALGGFAAAVVVLCGWPARLWGVATLGPLAALAVAGPVLVPLLVAFGETARGFLPVAPGGLEADTLAARRLIELAFPSLLGPPLADGNSGFWAAASFPWQRYYPSIFLGALPLFLIPWIVRGQRRVRPWLLLAAGGLLGGLVLSIPAVARCLEGFPGLAGARYGIKLLVLVTLAFPVLVAEGWQRCVASWSSSRRWRLALVTGALGLAALMPEGGLRAVMGRFYPASAEALANQPAGALARGWRRDLLALGVPLAGMAVAGPAPAVVAGAAAVGGWLVGSPVLAWDRASRWSTPPAVARRAGPSAEVVSFAHHGTPDEVPDRRELQRFWAARAVLTPEYGLRWGLRYPLGPGPDGLAPWRAEVMARLAGVQSPASAARLARALGATAIVGRKPVSGWVSEEVDGAVVSVASIAIESSYLANRTLSAASLDAAVLTLGSTVFRPGVDAVIEGTGGVEDLFGGEVHEKSGTPHCRRFETHTTGAGLLVIRQNYMRVWHARVDGRPVPTEPVNGTQLGVRVPAGRHDVEVFLDLRPYLWGWAGIPLLIVFAVVLRRRPPSRPQSERDSSGDVISGPSATQSCGGA